ncbi:MAG: ATP-binding protein [Methanobrevibacter sp.]|jgi:DNA helicase HerA-like ATPase|nr:ATP-binding protein [Candidatus Methanovirga basalitermitum]
MMIGRSIGETSLNNFEFISKTAPKVGEYVTLNYDGKIILGMIETLIHGSVSLNNDIYDPSTVDMIKAIEGNDFYIKGKVRILGDLNDNLRIPRTPAPPGTKIYLADKDRLNKVFQVKNPLKIGGLISQENVDVNVDINKMITRHLAILAMTGAGKSNTVCIIIDELLKYDGTMVIFDMHSEYVDGEFNNGELNLISPEINPIYMSFSEIRRLINIPSSAYIQERYFREAYKIAINETREGNSKDFLSVLKGNLNDWYESEIFRSKEIKSSEKTKIMDVINKVEDLENKYGFLLNTNVGDILSQIQLGKANIVDLGLSDETTAEVIVSHILRNALRSRKSFIHKKTDTALKFPVFFIVEEAHILAPKNRSINSKLWISRIAREGRKFGLGLCLVSQSPKSIDPDSLSQANNMIISRLVEPQDQRHVQSASENLSEDLLLQLPSLNIGEAIVVGLMVKVPTLIKVDEFKGRRYGNDLDVVGEWRQYKNNQKKETKQTKQTFKELGGDY